MMLRCARTTNVMAAAAARSRVMITLAAVDRTPIAVVQVRAAVPGFDSTQRERVACTPQFAAAPACSVLVQARSAPAVAFQGRPHRTFVGWFKLQRDHADSVRGIRRKEGYADPVDRLLAGRGG